MINLQKKYAVSFRLIKIWHFYLENHLKRILSIHTQHPIKVVSLIRECKFGDTASLITKFDVQLSH